MRTGLNGYKSAVKKERRCDQIKKLMTVVLSLIFAVGLIGVAFGGNIDSPGDPLLGSQMYTLQQI